MYEVKDNWCLQHPDIKVEQLTEFLNKEVLYEHNEHKENYTQ